MPWTSVTDDRGQAWRFNQLGLWILVRQNTYNRLLFSRTRTVRHHDFLGPERVHLDTNFSGIRGECDQESYPVYSEIAEQILGDADAARNRLIEMREETDQITRDMRSMLRATSRETSQNIERAIARAETGRAVATQVRNLSVQTLVVGSSLMTGGAGFAVLGAASVLSGVGQYEDTGNVGSAVLNGVGTFVVGAIPLAGGSLAPTASATVRVGGEAIESYGQRAALIVVGASIDAQFEAGKALIEGQSASSAFRAAGMKFGLDVLTGSVGLGLDHIAVPACVRLATDNVVEYARAGAALSSSGRGRATVDEPAAPSVRSMSMRGPSVSFAPASAPRPSRNLCDANAILSTGNCSAEAWVDDTVLHLGW